MQCQGGEPRVTVVQAATSPSRAAGPERLTGQAEPGANNRLHQADPSTAREQTKHASWQPSQR